MCSPQTEADLQQLEGRRTRKRPSVSSAFNDIRDVIEGQKEIEEDIGVNVGDFNFGSDEDFDVGERKKKRKVVKKKKSKLSIPKSSAAASLIAPNEQPAPITSRKIARTVKSEQVVTSISTQMKNPLSLATPSIVRIANEHDMKIPKIVPNEDSQGTLLLYTQAPSLPSQTIPTSQQVVETLSQTQNVSQGMIQAPTS